MHRKKDGSSRYSKDYHISSSLRPSFPPSLPQLSGHLLVNRVPGNFHIEARSNAHNLNAAMTNLSHVVNHLSFGPLYEEEVLSRLEKFSSEFYVSNSLDGRMFVLDEYHKAHHHYVKVVGTLYEVPQRWGKEEMFTYQMLPEVSEGGRKAGRQGVHAIDFFLSNYTHTLFSPFPLLEIHTTTDVRHDLWRGRRARSQVFLRNLAHGRDCQEDRPALV